MGLARAGFDVYGVDIKDQPNYPGWFKRADATTADLAGFDLIWASPPCQAFSCATPAHARGRHPNLVDLVRKRLSTAGALTVIENVPLAPLRADVVLTGKMFDLRLIRKRLFETNFYVPPPGEAESGRGLVKSGLVETVAGSGRGKHIIKRWSAAMGIDWMTRRELAQAIPPAYAEYIGIFARAALDDHRSRARQLLEPGSRRQFFRPDARAANS